MSNFIRTAIFNKIIRPLQNIDNVSKHRIMSNLYMKFNNMTSTYSFAFPLKSKEYDVTKIVTDTMKNDLEETFDDIKIKDNVIHFIMSRDKYMKSTLDSNAFSVTPPLLVEKNKHIVIEFSSPNIAKPFHLGHLRSTIIGNCISNICSFLENRVTKINYLGDWGTQFGYIHLGMEMTNIDNIEMQTDPIKTLYKVYVHANKLGESNPEINERAKEIFKQLEFGHDAINKNWQTIKHYTVLELDKTYKRIGVTFDRYDWESMYTAANIGNVINLMEEMQLLTLDSNNRKVISLNEKRKIPIIKSDGTTLYMSRDIAAAIDRFERNEFDAMYYIADYGQSSHFSELIQVLNKMNLSWANRLRHVQFGRVQGMSTRKGTAVFLEDILNEAQKLMKDNQIKRKTTKVSVQELDTSSDILAISGVIVQDLKQNRGNNYTFNWDSILDMKGDSGIKLQYTHCRLCSLEELSGASIATECDPSLLKEPEVDNLITLISQFDEVVLKSYNNLEPCTLTIYLFYLCKAINVALNKLKVKDESSDLGNQRMLLFHVARIILAQGMKLLGLTPLSKM